MQRSGEYISNLTGEAMYKSFRPAPLPPVLNMDDEMVSQLTSATKALATLRSHCLLGEGWCVLYATCLWR